MAAGEEDSTTLPLRLIHDVLRVSATGFSGFFKKDCTDLARRLSLLSHLLEEIRDSNKNCQVASSSCLPDITLAFQAAKRIIFAANNFDNSNNSSDGAIKKLFFQFQCVTWKLERALADLHYEEFEISEEVQEQVELVKAQLRRAVERYGGPLTLSRLNRAVSQPLDKEIDPFQRSNSLLARSVSSIDTKLEDLGEGCGLVNCASDEVPIETPLQSSEVGVSKDSSSAGVNDSSCQSLEENKKPNSPVIPDDFRCPVSLELMRDPVIVATGQTYERAYIQRWIDCGNTTCPTTQQKLQHLTLTPNYVLRSLISQWCLKNGVEQQTSLINRRIKRSDGSFREVVGDLAAIEAIVRKLSSRCIEDCRAAVAEIRSLSKRSTDNRILLAEAGAIPILVKLLTSDDGQIQDNAVTCILNLSIFSHNKGLIMFANAIPSIVQVLRCGSTEAKENAAATLFSLSIADENKIIIGASGAISALVDLLQNGSAGGKKDAATALFNLCIYQGNKGRAVRAGIIPALLEMLTNSSSCMVEEALTILSVLASHQEAKQAIVKACMIPVLIDILRTGSPRNKEHAAAILLLLCKRDAENLASLSRLGAAIPLSELTKTGTERAKRKAASLLEHLGVSHLI